MNIFFLFIVIVVASILLKKWIPPFLTMLCLSLTIPMLHLGDGVMTWTPILIIIKLLASSLLFLSVGQEATHAEKDVKILKFALYSSLPSFIGGALVGFYLNDFIFDIKKIWIFGCAFSLTAMPILSLWMKEYKIDAENKAKALQTVAWVDILAWVGLSLCVSPGEILISIIFLILGCCILFTIKKVPAEVFLLFYVLWFFLMEGFGGHGLMWGIVAAIVWRKVGKEHLNWKEIGFVVSWFVIPVTLILGFINVKIPNMLDLSLVISLIIVPLVLKNLSIKWAEKEVELLDRKYPWGVLLNARGLTELVFLSVAFHSSLLTVEQYSYLVSMSVVGTLMPAMPLLKGFKFFSR